MNSPNGPQGSSTGDVSERLLKLLHELDDALDSRHRFKVWRETMHFYEDVVTHDPNVGGVLSSEEFSQLLSLASEAFANLGGVPEPGEKSLRDYDSGRYGPFLGVSDEGSAARRIRDAMLHSPKVAVLGLIDPLTVGGAVDAERLAGAGEVAVGPDEYRDIQLACLGRIATTTNVTNRLNLRYYHNPPLIAVHRADERSAVSSAISDSRKALSPFLHTPDGKPRPVTLFARFSRSVKTPTRRLVLRSLKHEMDSGAICDPSCQDLGLFVRVPAGRKGSLLVRNSLDLAASAGIDKVAVEGVMRRVAYESIVMPGLLNFFGKETLNRLLKEARKKGISLKPWRQVDVDTVARSTWASLEIARRMGLHLGKYGLFPLTTHEGDYVVRKLQFWFPRWSAAPAIYVDCPLVTPDRVYDEGDAAEGVTRWLEMLRRHDVKVVLIDTADKAKGRVLLKQDERDPIGILSIEEIRTLDTYARNVGINVLWAGGISIPQAHKFGQLKVFGIYVTSATARKIAVSGDYVHDPSLPNEKEPTYRGVYRVKLLLEAGFVQTRLHEDEEDVCSGQVAGAANDLMTELMKDPEADHSHLEEKLNKTLIVGWKLLLRPDSSRTREARSFDEA